MELGSLGQLDDQLVVFFVDFVEHVEDDLIFPTIGPIKVAELLHVLIDHRPKFFWPGRPSAKKIFKKSGPGGHRLKFFGPIGRSGV